MNLVFQKTRFPTEFSELGGKTRFFRVPGSQVPALARPGHPGYLASLGHAAVVWSLLPRSSPPENLVFKVLVKNEVLKVWFFT